MAKYPFISQRESSLTYKIRTLEWRIFKLEQMIETARQEWTSYGADESIKRLVANLKKSQPEVGVGLPAKFGQWLIRVGWMLNAKPSVKNSPLEKSVPHD